MSLKRKSRSLGQLAGLGATGFGSSKSNQNQKSGLLRTTSRNPEDNDEGSGNQHKKVSRTTPKVRLVLLNSFKKSKTTEVTTELPLRVYVLKIFVATMQKCKTAAATRLVERRLSGIMK